jgi:predicted Zn-dependent protease
MTGGWTSPAAAGDDQVGSAEEVAERVLERVRARSRDAEAEVTVRRGVEALTRFARSFIHQNVAQETNHASIGVALDGRMAAVSVDGPLDDEALDRVIEAALEAARVRPQDPEWPGLAPAAEPPEVDHWDDATAAASPDDRARLVADFVTAAGGLETAGSCATEAVSIAYANTSGQRLIGRMTTAALDGIARSNGSDGSGRGAARALGVLDGRRIGERAARKARAATAAGDLEPGRYQVVLEPRCVADVVQFLFIYGFNGRAVEEGRSFVRLGEAQFDGAITLRDDPTDAGTVGVPFDVEGTPRAAIDVVRDGVTSGVLHTRRTAARAGTTSTGHAAEQAQAWGALPSNPILAAGAPSDDELVGQMERGLLVTDFWYTRILDPRTQVVTGLTRNGVWLVEDGRIVRPVSDMRFTQSFLDALAPGAVRGVGSDRALIPSAFGGWYLVPSLHLASWNFTGGAQG